METWKQHQYGGDLVRKLSRPVSLGSEFSGLRKTTSKRPNATLNYSMWRDVTLPAPNGKKT